MENFNSDVISNFSVKYQLFRILTEEINTFIENYNKEKKIDKGILEELCNFFIECQINFSNDFDFINMPDYCVNTRKGNSLELVK